MNPRKSLMLLALATSAATMIGTANAQSSTYPGGSSGQSATDRPVPRERPSTTGTRQRQATRDGTTSAAPPDRGNSAARGTEPSMNPLSTEEAAGRRGDRGSGQERYNADPDRVRIEKQQRGR